jgi:hypothetical protein
MSELLPIHFHHNAQLARMHDLWSTNLAAAAIPRRR